MQTSVGWIQEKQQGATRKKCRMKNKLCTALCWVVDFFSSLCMLSRVLWFSSKDEAVFSVCTRLTFILPTKYARFLILLVFSLHCAQQCEVILFHCIPAAVVPFRFSNNGYEFATLFPSLSLSHSTLSFSLAYSHHALYSMFRWFSNGSQRLLIIYIRWTKIIQCTNNHRTSEFQRV